MNMSFSGWYIFWHPLVQSCLLGQDKSLLIIASIHNKVTSCASSILNIVIIIIIIVVVIIVIIIIITNIIIIR